MIDLTTIDLTTIVHVTSDPACRHHNPELLDAHRGLACHVCVPCLACVDELDLYLAAQPQTVRHAADDVLDDDLDLDDDTRLELGDPRYRR